MTKLGWGILGTGGIAKKFAGQLPDVNNGQLVAVGSRSQESATRFCADFGGQPYGSYDALLADHNVDVVYISLPNTLHAEWSIRAMQAGKHVLCEKPIASTTGEAEQMFATADQEGRHLVEGFMYRFQPIIQHVLQLVRNGAIGQVRIIRSNFTFNRPINEADIRYQPGLAGGSIMDVGCYCVNFARALASAEPTDLYAAAHICDTGVDDYAAGTMHFPSDILCTFTCGMSLFADRTTFIGGTGGWLRIPFPWHSDGMATLVKGLDDEQPIAKPAPIGAYALQAEAVADLILNGTPTPASREDTLGNMAVLDQLRASAGLSY